MRKLIKIALLLLIVVSCKKEDDQFPIKFLDDVYPNNYTTHTSSNPLKLPFSFTALESVSYGNDQDIYLYDVSPNADFSTFCKRGSVGLKRANSRTVVATVTIFKSDCNQPPVLYYRVYRYPDNKSSETRKINIVWD